MIKVSPADCSLSKQSSGGDSMTSLLVLLGPTMTSLGDDLTGIQRSSHTRLMLHKSSLPLCKRGVAQHDGLVLLVRGGWILNAGNARRPALALGAHFEFEWRRSHSLILTRLHLQGRNQL